MTTWRDAAACQGVDPEPFFSTAGPSPAATRICQDCPVTTDCLEDALNAGPGLDGIYGGTTRNERRRILLQRQGGQPGPRAARYSLELRAKAITTYREIRPMYTSNTNAAIAVAKHLGIGSHKSVIGWLAADNQRKATEAT